MTYWHNSMSSPNDSTSQYFSVKYSTQEACETAGLGVGYGRFRCSLVNDPAPVPIVTNGYTIRGQNGMTGTIDIVTGHGLLWHITSPMVVDFYYGAIDAYPGTWTDANGVDQAVVIKTGGWSGNDAAFDQNYSGGMGEFYKPGSEITITSQGAGVTSIVTLTAAGQKLPTTTTTTGTGLSNVSMIAIIVLLGILIMML